MEAIGDVLPINYIDLDEEAREIDIGHKSETPIKMKAKEKDDVHYFLISYKLRAKDEEYTVN